LLTEGQQDEINGAFERLENEAEKATSLLQQAFTEQMESLLSRYASKWGWDVLKSLDEQYRIPDIRERFDVEAGEVIGYLSKEDEDDGPEPRHLTQDE
jgi:hypothetical protein